MKAGRQVSKSVNLTVLLLLATILRNAMRSLYVSNLSIQTARFSKQYINEFLKSEIFKEYIKVDVDNVNSKYFSNGSSIELSYISDDPSRVRGVPSDMNVYDEIQDIAYDDIPIVRECISGSPYGFEIFAGTPKTLENTIQALWHQCNKLEWVIQCEACGYYNVPDEDGAVKMIQKQGPSCQKCGKRVSVRNGKWTMMEEGTSQEFYGFHLPQIILPMHSEEYDFNTKRYIPNSFDDSYTSKWRELYKKYSEYTKIKFYNEILGLSQDEGGRILTLSELKECANLPKMDDINLEQYDELRVAGIDWGISAESSYTVFTVLTHINDKVHVVFAKKFASTDILQIIREILELCHKYKVKIIAADRGVGFTNNAILKQELGMHRVVEYQYGAFRRLQEYNKKSSCYLLDKTTSLEVLFMNMKSKNVRFPPFEEMEDYFMQILSEYEEYLETPKKTYKVFRRNPSMPDDFLHALNFGVMAMYRLLGVRLLNMDSIGIGSSEDL